MTNEAVVKPRNPMRRQLNFGLEDYIELTQEFTEGSGFPKVKKANVPKKKGHKNGTEHIYCERPQKRGILPEQIQVDTNVGQICVRLGWVPLQPLPESVQIHLELYYVMNPNQARPMARLCKLDQETPYDGIIRIQIDNDARFVQSLDLY